jgi:hypothetical protein
MNAEVVVKALTVNGVRGFDRESVEPTWKERERTFHIRKSIPPVPPLYQLFLAPLAFP